MVATTRKLGVKMGMEAVKQESAIRQGRYISSTWEGELSELRFIRSRQIYA